MLKQRVGPTDNKELSGDVSMSLSNIEIADHRQITNDELLRHQGPEEVIQKVTFKETETIVESWTACVLGTNPMKFFKNPVLDANTNPFVRMLWRSAIAVGIYIRHKNLDEHNEEELDSKNVFLGLKYDYSKGIDERLQPNPNLLEWGWNFPKHPN